MLRHPAMPTTAERRSHADREGSPSRADRDPFLDPGGGDERRRDDAVGDDQRAGAQAGDDADDDGGEHERVLTTGPDDRHPVVVCGPALRTGSCRGLVPADRRGRSGPLNERLRQLGIRPAQARNTALFQFATELPADLLARMLGIHITVAWQRASAGDWTNYAAEVSRRTTH